jgi:rRNA biogenesis protein RRP5
LELAESFAKQTVMGAFKRKADPESAPSKKDKGASGDRSAKRPRKSESNAEHTTPSKVKPESSTQKSIFKDEETAFPRGGASVLTPLEHKQIQIKATQDVLFEQAGGIKRGGDDGLSDQGSDAADEDRKKAAKKRKSKKSKTAQDEEPKEPKVKAEGLTAKVCKFALSYSTDLT